MKRYLVLGWDESDYEDDADHSVVIKAKTAGDAEEKADTRWKKAGIFCNTVEAYES